MRSQWHMRLRLLPIPLAALVLSCAAPGSPSGPSQSTGPSSLAPSVAVASPTVAPTRAPSPTRAPTPSPTAAPTPSPEPVSLADLAPNVPDSFVIVQANLISDIGGSRTPALTVYRDGHVLFFGDGPRVARLTTAGRDSLVALVLDAGFLSMAESVPVDTTYAAGYMSYVVALRQGDELVTRRTTNAPDPAHRAEADAIIALVERIVDVGHVLPGSAWAVPPGKAAAFVPSMLLFKVTAYDNPLADRSQARLDVADVRWPFATPLLGFGGLLANPPLGPGSTSRCAVVTLADAASIEQAIAPAPWGGWIPTSERMSATLNWNAGHGHVEVSLGELLPEDPNDCAVDGSWP